MGVRKTVAPELLAQGRRLYEETDAPVAAIYGMLNVSRSKFYEMARELGWRNRQASLTFSLGRTVVEAVSLPVASEAPLPAPAQEPLDPEAELRQRTLIAQRLLQVAEREMDAIERIIAVLRPADQRDAQHSARTLASVSRTLRDIKHLTQTRPETPTDDPDDDPIPDNVDDFRLAIAARIEALFHSEPRRAGEEVVEAGSEVA